MNFDLTAEELNIIGAGLQELPLKTALPVWTKLQEQYKKQTEGQQKTAE